MNTDYRAARIQGKRNEKFRDQNVFSILLKARGGNEGALYLHKIKTILQKNIT